MKKFLLGLGLLALVVSLKADFNYNTPAGPYLGASGGVIDNQSAISIGYSPRRQAVTSSFWGSPQVNVVAGDPLVFVTSGTGPVLVSKTTSIGDANFIGIALTTANATTATVPTQVLVANAGVVRCLVGNSVTIGGYVITSGVAGYLTPIAAATTSPFAGWASISYTALVGRVLETKTMSGSVTPTALILLGK